jgi:hypothetical protein
VVARWGTSAAGGIGEVEAARREQARALGAESESLMSAATRVELLTCSSCDDYQLIPNPADGGMLMRCPDCISRTAVRCPLHGRSLRDGKCRDCSYEAQVAEELIELGGVTVLHPLAAALEL